MEEEDREVHQWLGEHGLLGAVGLIIVTGGGLAALELLRRRAPGLSAGAASRIVGFGARSHAAAQEIQTLGRVRPETLAQVPRSDSAGRTGLGYSVVATVTTEQGDKVEHVVIHQPATAETTIEQLTEAVLQQLDDMGDDSPRLGRYVEARVEVRAAWRS